jgi:pimeloyl-ACP methyl ester carboxylesterase
MKRSEEDAVKDAVLDVRGTSVRMLEAGTGPTVLMLHGIDGPAVDQLNLELAKTHRVIVPELPGFARSPIPEWMMSVNDAAYFVMDMMEAIGGRVHLAGHSIGGWIAAEVAIRSTQNIDTLTLLAPAGVMPVKAPEQDVFLLTGDAGVRQLFHDQKHADEELQRRAAEPIDITLQNRAGLARLAWTPRMASVTLEQWLHRIKVPTLIAWGEDDKILPFANHTSFLREMPHAKFVGLPACGHAIPHERGMEIARHMHNLISGAK